MFQAELGRRALIRGFIALGVVGGELRPDEALAVRTLPEPEAAEFLLARKLTFFGGAEFDRVGPALLEKLLDLRVGEGDWAADVEFMNQDRSIQRTVTTVREYRRAVADGLFHSSNRDMRVATRFELVSGVINAATNAERAAISHLPAGANALHDLSAISASFAYDFVEGLPLTGSVAEAVKAGFVQADTRSPGILTLTRTRMPTGGTRHDIHELLRADLNGDGIEEMLVYVHSSAIGGSLALGRTVSLVRPARDALLQEAPDNQVDAPVA